MSIYEDRRNEERVGAHHSDVRNFTRQGIWYIPGIWSIPTSKREPHGSHHYVWQVDSDRRDITHKTLFEA